MALYSSNRPEVRLEVLFAAWRAGLVVVPLDVRLHPTELEARLQDAEASVLFCTEEVAAARTAGVGAVLFGATYERLLADGADTPPHFASAPDDLAWIFFTSGTTGSPKGAMLTHRNLLALVASNLSELETQEQEVVLHALPLSHAGGFYMLYHVARGCAHVFLPTNRFDPEAFFATARSQGVTSVALAPTMIIMLLSCGRSCVAPALRTVLYGGAPMPRPRIEEAIARMGQVFVQSYGLGEVPLTATVLGRTEHRGERLGSAGRPTPFTALRAIDEHGQDVAPGAAGEVALRGDLVMTGYWRQPDGERTTRREPGLLGRPSAAKR